MTCLPLPPKHTLTLITSNPAPRLLETARGGHQWEETLSTWVALHAFTVRCQRIYAPTASPQPLQQQPGSPPGSPGAIGGSSGRQSSAGGAGERQFGVPPGLPRLVAPVPGLEVFLLDLFSMEGDAESQLDYLARHRPPAMGQGDWDRGVSQVRVPAAAALSCLGRWILD